MIDKKHVCALGSIYDGEQAIFFTQCLDSLKEQTVSIPLYLVIDGPLRQELDDLIDENRDLFAGIFRLKKNLGLSSALNFGLDGIPEHYTHVIRFDSDDINFAYRFEKLIYNFEPNDAVLGSWVTEFSGNEEVIKKVPKSVNKNSLSPLFRNPLNHPSVMFNRSIVSEANGYENVPFFEDWFLWLKIIQSGGTIRNIEEPLLLFRFDEKTFRRRRGLSYAKNEFFFFFKATHVFPRRCFWILIAYLMRTAVRLSPKPILKLAYRITRSVHYENR